MLPTNGTASGLEAVWTIVALLGAGFATALLAHIWLSYRAVVAWIGHGWAVRWGPRHKFVLGFLVGIGLLLLTWCGFVALGVNALTNPPPGTPDRLAASERGGWILVGLEGVLFAFQGVLLWAWVAVGQATLTPHPEKPTLGALMLTAIDAGREMGHLVRNRLSEPVGLLDLVLESATLTDAERADLTTARDQLVSLAGETAAIHDEIKHLEPHP